MADSFPAPASSAGAAAGPSEAVVSSPPPHAAAITIAAIAQTGALVRRFLMASSRPLATDGWAPAGRTP